MRQPALRRFLCDRLILWRCKRNSANGAAAAVPGSAAIKSENNREQGENRRKKARARHCKYEVILPPRSFSLPLSLILSLLRGKQNFTIRSVSLSEPVNRHLFRRSLLHQRSIPVGSGDKDTWRPDTGVAWIEFRQFEYFPWNHFRSELYIARTPQTYTPESLQNHSEKLLFLLIFLSLFLCLSLFFSFYFYITFLLKLIWFRV